MPRVCSICTHAQRAAIDRSIVLGAPCRDVASRYGLTKSSVDRHAKTHLSEKVVSAASAKEVLDAEALVAELRLLRETTLAVLSEAREEKSHGAALAAIARLEHQAELIGRFVGELIERHQVESVSAVFSSEWIRLRPIIVGALAPYPEASAAVVLALTASGLDRAER
jgi:hypothetical protein